MPIPDYETVMLPLLELAATRGEAGIAISEAVDVLAGHFHLTEEERAELLPSRGSFKFNSRVGWARTYLQKAGLLEAAGRGQTRITKRGKDVLMQQPKRIDGTLLAQFEEFREFQGKKKQKKGSDENETQVSQTPRE